MESLCKAGNDCVLACREGSKIALEATRRDLRWLPVGFCNSIDIVSMWKVRQILLKKRIDIAFCHSGHDTNVLTMSARFLKGPPILIRVRTYLPGVPRARSFQALDRILVPSSFLMNQLKEQPGIDSRRVDVLRPAIDLEKIQSASTNPLPEKLELFLRSHSPNLVHAAMLRSEKGHKLALSMVAKLKHKFPQIGYVIAGAGPEEEKLRKLAVRLGIDKRVFFAGFVSPVSALMARADLVIMPSLKEPLGTAQLEALALGIPVAVSDAGGLPETVTGGVTGCILPAGNLMGWVAGVAAALSDPKASRKRAALGRKNIEESYSEHTYLQRFEEQIELAEKDRRSAHFSQ
jgi:glycosyltransferase involved in cell wall biosynthesis